MFQNKTAIFFKRGTSKKDENSSHFKQGQHIPYIKLFNEAVEKSKAQAMKTHNLTQDGCITLLRSRSCS